MIRRNLLYNSELGGGNIGYHNGYEYVDLGLPSGLLWATCNVGAENPEDYGGYYCWGGSKDKDLKDYYAPQYYMTSLPTSEDTARRLMKGNWRMPTQKEVQELVNNTDSIWTTINNIKGRLCTSKINGAKIFFPASGQYYLSYGYYGESIDFQNGGKVGTYLTTKANWINDKFLGVYALTVQETVFKSDDNTYTAYDVGNSVRPVLDPSSL